MAPIGNQKFFPQNLTSSSLHLRSSLPSPSIGHSFNHMSENMEQSPEMLLSPPIPSLPDDVTIDIVARVPRSHYPTLSLVSKSFRKLIASSKLYKRRSQLGITQRRLYAVLRNRKTGEFSFYVLHRKLNGYNRLVVVRSLPFMSSRGSCVSVGSKVYVFNDLSVLSFDCTSHTVQRGPNFPQRISYKEANVIGKKVYVIGDAFCHYVQGTGWMKVWQKAVTVFDTETESLEPKLVKEDMAVGVGPFWSDSVVLEDKIYLKGYMNGNSFVYGPEERKWELMDEIAFLRLEVGYVYFKTCLEVLPRQTTNYDPCEKLCFKC
ncbi:unnamed protein product [Brassica oleracea var. botrytis]